MNTLDLSRLVMAKRRGGKLIAQCPACAAHGADRSGEHFVAYDDGAGKWGCGAHPGDKEHRRQIAEILGSTERPAPVFTPPSRRIIRELRLPALRQPTLGEVIQIAEQRGLPTFAGLERARLAGMLHAADMHDGGEAVTAWLLTDSKRISAQARRMDGKPWQGIGGAKAKTLPGSQAAWPIGAADIGSRPYVALCEGGPDTLAAWTLAQLFGRSREIAPVCMTGAGNHLHADALDYFRGKGVWTFPHRDPKGQQAQENWTIELMDAGAEWVKPFDVEPHKDLNEWLTAAARGSEDEP